MIDRDEVAMAGPRLAVRIAELIRLGKLSSGLSQKEIAAALGVGEARVSQILNGDGNLHVTTVARVFAAMGFDAEFKVFDSADNELKIARRAKRRDPRDAEYSHSVESPDGKIHTVRSWAYRQVNGRPVDFPLHEDQFMSAEQAEAAEALVKSAQPKTMRVFAGWSETEPEGVTR